MKYKEIKLKDNKSVLVDESADVKEGDWFIGINNSIWQCKLITPIKACKLIVATINHSISLDVPMIVVEDKINHLKWIYNRLINVHLENKNNDYMLKFNEIIQSLNQEYIELEMEEVLIPNEEGIPNCFVETKVKTSRVNGQLTAYVKQ